MACRRSVGACRECRECRECRIGGDGRKRVGRKRGGRVGVGIDAWELGRGLHDVEFGVL